MYEQRKVSWESFHRRKHETLWSPSVERDGKLSATTQIRINDWYAVVDDIAEGTAVLQIASWPKLDRGGHLRFHDIHEQPYPLDALQKVINRWREKHGQPAADRPLRTGDAFLIQCEDRLGENVINPQFKGSVIDITAAAREQAKIAMYGAVARKLSSNEAKNRLETPREHDRFQRTVDARERMYPKNPRATAKPEV